MRRKKWTRTILTSRVIKTCKVRAMTASNKIRTDRMSRMPRRSRKKRRRRITLKWKKCIHLN